MKKRKLLLTVSLTLLLFTTNYKAVCNNDEIVTSLETMHYSTVAYIDTEKDLAISEIQILDIPSDVYVIAVNNTANDRKVFDKIENGGLTITAPNVNRNQNYTIRFYSSNIACENELLKTIQVTTLAYNPYADEDVCFTLLEKNIEFDGCNKFSEKEYNEKSFTAGVEKALKEQDPEPVEKKVENLFYEYYYWFLIPVAVLGIYYFIRLVIIKRRKKKDEENQIE